MGNGEFLSIQNVTFSKTVSIEFEIWATPQRRRDHISLNARLLTTLTSKCEKEKAIEVTNEKKALTVYDILNAWFPLAFLSSTRWRYLQIDRCVSPIIWAWPICWTFTNILGTIYIVNVVLFPTSPPITPPDRNAYTWNYPFLNSPVSSSIRTPTLIPVGNGAFSTWTQITRVNWRKWSHMSTTAMLRSCC